MKDVTTKMAVNKADLMKLQEEDLTLQKFKDLKDTEMRKG